MKDTWPSTQLVSVETLIRGHSRRMYEGGALLRKYYLLCTEVYAITWY